MAEGENNSVYNQESQRVHAWAAQLKHKRLRKITRLLDDPEDRPFDINRSFEPLVVVVDDEEPMFLTVDEGQGNLLLWPYAEIITSRPKVFGDYFPVDVDCQSLFGSPSLDGFGTIQSVTALSLGVQDFPPDYYTLCGLRLTSHDGTSFSLGSHLTYMDLGGLWLVPNAEVVSTIREHEL